MIRPIFTVFNFPYNSHSLNTELYLDTKSASLKGTLAVCTVTLWTFLMAEMFTCSKFNLWQLKFLLTTKAYTYCPLLESWDCTSGPFTLVLFNGGSPICVIVDRSSSDMTLHVAPESSWKFTWVVNFLFPSTWMTGIFDLQTTFFRAAFIWKVFKLLHFLRFTDSSKMILFLTIAAGLTVSWAILLVHVEFATSTCTSSQP